ncbi:MAG: 3-deoxy-D-manno-octulosonic acid transferase [Fidelibacterota bacterium]
MKYFWKFLYNFIVVPLGVVLYYLFSVFSHKMRTGISGRHKTMQRIKKLRKAHPDRELILFHSASLGEYEQVKPVVQGIKQKRPDILTIVSFTSPSGFENADRIDAVDLFIYLPFDFRPVIRTFLKELRPDKIIFVTYELWPNVLSVSAKMGITTYLISARIRSTSKKWRFYVRGYFTELYNTLDNIYAVTDEDAWELNDILTAGRTNVQILGDPRYDQVIQRAECRSKKNIPQLFTGGFVICAGSVWEQDLAVISTPLKNLLQKNPRVKLIIAPHETDDFHVNQVKSQFASAGFNIQRYTELEGACTGRLLVIDKIGLLAELYHQSDLAFVGGGFKKAVHNVMEPAIAGIPVIFGPNYHNSRESQQLVKYQGGFSVANAKEFEQILSELLQDKEKYNTVSAASKKVILSNKGAAVRTVEHILNNK